MVIFGGVGGGGFCKSSAKMCLCECHFHFLSTEGRQDDPMYIWTYAWVRSHVIVIASSSPSSDSIYMSSMCINCLVAQTLHDFCRGTLSRHKLSRYVYAMSQENRTAPLELPRCPCILSLWSGGVGGRASSCLLEGVWYRRCHGYTMSRYSGPLGSTIPDNGVTPWCIMRVLCRFHQRCCMRIIEAWFCRRTHTHQC